MKPGFVAAFLRSHGVATAGEAHEAGRDPDKSIVSLTCDPSKP